MVSLRPVSHSDTRGRSRPSRVCIAVKAATLRRMRSKSSVPRTVRKVSRVGGIERDAQLVEPGLGQLAALPRRERGAVGVEQHVDAALLQVAHPARQIPHQHRLADAVQHHARDVGHLADDAGEQLPAHVRLRLQIGVGARAGGAEQVAAVGGLQVEADRIGRRRRARGRPRQPHGTDAGRSRAVLMGVSNGGDGGIEGVAPQAPHIEGERRDGGKGEEGDPGVIAGPAGALDAVVEERRGERQGPGGGRGTDRQHGDEDEEVPGEVRRGEDEERRQ